MPRPTVLITTDLDWRTTRGVREQIAWVKRVLVDAVSGAGGVPLLATHVPPADVGRLLGVADALLLSGSIADVPPERYGEALHPSCGPLLPERSALEAALVAEALRTGVPILGICGGFQLINVALGGSLHQDLSLRPAPSLAHVQAGSHYAPGHRVELVPGSRLAKLMGCQTLEVTSTHHQVIARLAADLVATAHAPDGVIEAVEHRRAAPLLAVQWHPEYLVASQPLHARLFEWLVAAARPGRDRLAC